MLQRDAALERYHRTTALLAELLLESESHGKPAAASKPGQQLVAQAATRLGGVAALQQQRTPSLDDMAHIEDQQLDAEHHAAGRGWSAVSSVPQYGALQPDASEAILDTAVALLVHQRGVPLELE